MAGEPGERPEVCGSVGDGDGAGVESGQHGAQAGLASLSEKSPTAQLEHFLTGFAVGLARDCMPVGFIGQALSLP